MDCQSNLRGEYPHRTNCADSILQGNALGYGLSGHAEELELIVDQDPWQ